MLLKKFIIAPIVTVSLLFSAAYAKKIDPNLTVDETLKLVAKDYAELVYKTYDLSYKESLKLKESINHFLKNPTKEKLEKAKKSWIQARVPYLQTEVFRFYEGPIDFVNQETGEEGPEGRLNSWPVNEAYIDYVTQNPKAGLILNTSFTLNKDQLKKNNQTTDEANISIGWHAIEFLLWGQDLNNTENTTTRTYSDYIPDNEINIRRADYLQLTINQLVEDIEFLKKSWNINNKESYAYHFVQKPTKESLANILTGMATLAGFEMATERMEVALDSGDQEDEQSCFSDTTHQDFIYDAQGIKNVYFNTLEKADGSGLQHGVGLHYLFSKVAPELNIQLHDNILETEKQISELHSPFDEILKAKKESKLRKDAEKTVALLHKQSELIQKIAHKFDIKLTIEQE